MIDDQGDAYMTTRYYKPIGRNLGEDFLFLILLLLKVVFVYKEYATGEDYDAREMFFLF